MLDSIKEKSILDHRLQVQRKPKTLVMDVVRHHNDRPRLPFLKHRIPTILVVDLVSNVINETLM